MLKIPTLGTMENGNKAYAREGIEGFWLRHMFKTPSLVQHGLIPYHGLNLLIQTVNATFSLLFKSSFFNFVG